MLLPSKFSSLVCQKPCTTASAADHRRASCAEVASRNAEQKRGTGASRGITMAFVTLFAAGAAHAAGHAEPSNALSVPTW